MSDSNVPNSMFGPEGKAFTAELTAPDKQEELPQWVADYYEISSKAATAGMGDVLFGRDKRTMQYYALKTYQGNKELFQREARFSLQLEKHPNVIYTYSVIEYEGKYYMVMEFIGPRPFSVNAKMKGTTLQTELKHFRHGLEPKQALFLAIDFCHGMEYLYKQKGFTGHNDIKPANLFITQDNVLKVGDFGLVNEKKGSTRGYRPPEFWKGEEGEQRDIWSFGIVFYEMLNGPKNPNFATVYGKREIHANTREYECLDWNLIKKSKYSAILEKCLVQDRKERYAHFADLRKDLEKELAKLGGDLRIRGTRIPEELTAYENIQKSIGWNTFKEYEISLAFCERAKQLSPQDAQIYLIQGSNLHRLKRYEEAIASYDMAIKLKPNYEFAYGYRGAVLHDLKRYEEALLSYDKAIKLDPKYAFAYNDRGVAKKDLGRYEEAIADYNKAIKLDPTYALAYYNCGNALYDIQRYKEAVMFYSEAIKQDPKDSSAYFGRGVALYFLKRYDDSIEDYKKTILLNPKSEIAHHNLATVLYHLDRYEEAVDEYNKAILLNSKGIYSYNGRGAVLFCLERYEESIADYTDAIKLDPKYTKAYINRGKALFAIEKYENAAKDYTKAIELDPKKVDSYFYRAGAYLRLKNYKAAEKDLKHALSLDKNNLGTLKGLLELYQATNHPRKAAQIQKKLDELGKNK